MDKVCICWRDGERLGHGEPIPIRLAEAWLLYEHQKHPEMEHWIESFEPIEG